MIADYIVTLFAIAGLFINPKKPWLSFFIWTGTNFWWALWNFRAGNFSQAVMFFVFTVSCAVQFWRTS